MCWNYVPETALNKKVSSHKRGHLFFIELRIGSRLFSELSRTASRPVSGLNDGPSATLNLSGGSFSLPASTTVPVTPKKGLNTITFGNAGTFAPGLDRITIRGNGDVVVGNR